MGPGDGLAFNYTFHDLLPLTNYSLGMLPHGDITDALDMVAVNSSKVCPYYSRLVPERLSMLRPACRTTLPISTLSPMRSEDVLARGKASLSSLCRNSILSNVRQTVSLK